MLSGFRSRFSGVIDHMDYYIMTNRMDIGCPELNKKIIKIDDFFFNFFLIIIIISESTQHSTRTTYKGKKMAHAIK